MDPHRVSSPTRQVGKKVAAVRPKSSAGLQKVKAALFSSADGHSSALQLLHGMVQRNPTINKGLEPIDAVVSRESPSVEQLNLTEESVLAKTESLISLLYEWNRRAFIKLSMNDTLQILHRIGREAGNHLMDFENLQRQGIRRAKAAADLVGAADVAQHDDPTFEMPIPPDFVDDEDLFADHQQEMTTTGGVGHFPDIDDDLFIES